MSSDGTEHWKEWGAATIVSLAVLAGLHYKGISGETVADAVKDVGQALMTFLAAFIAVKIFTNQKSLSTGEDALRSVQKKYPKVLSGPKFNREGYDSDKTGKADRYLFLQRQDQKERAPLIPVSPLNEGIIEIRVSKRTLKILGVDVGADGWERVHQETLAKVKRAVVEALEPDWHGTYEILDHKKPDIAVQVDFDESNIGPKKFGKALSVCAEAAIKAVNGLAK